MTDWIYKQTALELNRALKQLEKVKLMSMWLADKLNDADPWSVARWLEVASYEVEHGWTAENIPTPPAPAQLTQEQKDEIDGLDYDELEKDYFQIHLDALGDGVEPESMGDFADSVAHGMVTCKHDTAIPCTEEYEEAAAIRILKRFEEHRRIKFDELLKGLKHE